MDFANIGVRSRKTGITARKDVRRDEHNMEDIDDFFRDEQPAKVNSDNNSLSANAQRGPIRQHQSNKTNGKIIFPSSNRDRSPKANKLASNSPLRSPLQMRIGHTLTEDRVTTDHIPTNDDLFTDALEEPFLESGGNDDESEENMDIDDESKGTIRVINNASPEQLGDYSFNMQEDLDRVPIPSKSTPKNTQNRSEKLFVSPDSPIYTGTAQAQRLKQLEKNMSVRSPSKRKRYQNSVSPPLSLHRTSPLVSMISKSPSQPSSRSIASLSKKIALNRSTSKKRTGSRKSPKSGQNIRLSTKTIESSDGDHSEYSGRSVSEDSSDAESLKNNLSIQNQNSSPSPSTAEESLPEDLYDSDKGPTKGIKTQRNISSKATNEYSEEEEQPDRDSSQPQEVLSNQNRGRGRSRNRRISMASRVASPSQRRHITDIIQLQAQQSRSSSNIRDETGPVRRSSRIKVPPLAFWRNEKAVFQKKNGDAVPTLKEIITVDEVVEPLRSRQPSRVGSRAQSRIKTSRKPLSRKQSAKSNYVEILEDINEEDQSSRDLEPDEDDEEERQISRGIKRGSEWLKNGFLKVDTFEGHGSDEKSNRLIAWAPGTESFTSSFVSDTDNFKLAILFDKNREFIATGMMLIPPGGVKSLKSTDATYFVFYCISGVIEVTLSGSVFFIKKGCSLEVPMGNFYQFVNKGKNDATMFFVQTRGHDADEWDE